MIGAPGVVFHVMLYDYTNDSGSDDIIFAPLDYPVRVSPELLNATGGGALLFLLQRMSCSLGEQGREKGTVCYA